MSKAVLISIRPKWCELIASGKKTIEVRKTRPKLETPFKCYIYCTKFHPGDPDSMINLKGRTSFFMPKGGAVIGDFVCKLIDTYTLHTTPNYYTDYYNISPNGGLLYAVGGDDQTQIPEDELLAYGKGQNIYGWHISNLVIYDEPKKMNDFMRKPCDFAASCGACNHAKWLSGHRFDGCELTVTRPPQSFCYVEDMT